MKKGMKRGVNRVIKDSNANALLHGDQHRRRGRAKRDLHCEHPDVINHPEDEEATVSESEEEYEYQSKWRQTGKQGTYFRSRSMWKARLRRE
jgi:hypothetical protein